MGSVKRYQVFISSTYEDLKKERNIVWNAIVESGNIPVGMEYFPAANETAWEHIQKVIDDTDYYILIIAGCYGSCDTTGKSYTQKEYEYALSKDISIIPLIIDDIGKLPNDKCEKTKQGKDKLKKFVTLVLKSHHIKKWQSPEELPRIAVIALQQAIQDSPAIGWVRANRIDHNENSDSPDLIEIIDRNLLLDCAKKNKKIVKLNSSIVSIAFENSPKFDNTKFVVDMIGTGTSHAIVWSDIMLPYGKAPEINCEEGAINRFTFETNDKGKNWTLSSDGIYNLPK